MNTNDRYREIKRKICGYAEQDEAIKAVIAIGSLTRQMCLLMSIQTLILSL